MKFVLVNTDEGVEISLSSVEVILQGDDLVDLQKVSLAALLSVDEQLPMLSLDFKNRFFAAVKHQEKAKRLALAARLNAVSPPPQGAVGE